jgi:hypothetical protein
VLEALEDGIPLSTIARTVGFSRMQTLRLVDRMSYSTLSP